MDLKKVAEEWEIWDEEKEVAKSEEKEVYQTLKVASNGTDIFCRK